MIHFIVENSVTMYITTFVAVHVWLLVISNAFNDISPINIPDADILINPDKGFVLQRVGTYSSEIETAIIHTFIPINEFCDTSSNTDKCVITPTSKSMRLATVSSKYMIDHFSGLLNNRNISLSIESSIKSMSSIYGHGGFLPHFKSNFHFFEGFFYLPMTTEIITENQPETTDAIDSDPINNDDKKTIAILLE